VSSSTGLVSRLTVGWQEAGRPASLRDHIQRYGETPRHRARSGTGDLIDQVAAAGLTGRGGAGFPTGTKMRSVAGRRGSAVLVANGMESEPASEKDQALLAHAPHLVLDGIQAAGQAVGASVAYLCLPSGKDWLAGIMRSSLRERHRARLDTIGVEVHLLPQHYVSSEETSLVHWLNGGDARPTMTPPRPYEHGVRKRPTLIDNVETLAHVALIARYGPGWFRQAGQPDSPGTMLTTVSGAVAEPGSAAVGDARDDGKPQPRAILVAARAPETAHHQGPFRLWYARALVQHTHGAVLAHIDDYFAAGFGVLDGVVRQVADGIKQLSLGMNRAHHGFRSTQRMGTPRFGKSPHQRRVGGIEKNHRGRKYLSDLAKDGRKTVEVLALTHVNHQRRTVDLRRLPDQIGKCRDQLQRHVVHRVETQILKRF